MKGGFEVNFYELFNEYETITDGEVTASNAYEDIAFDVACEELAQAFGENFDSRIDEYAMKEAAYEARQEMLYSTY